jgi:Zn-finger nucleic acid-binding protein
VKLVACKNCRAQYDTTEMGAEPFECRCGTMVENIDLTGVNAKILRCGACGAAVSEAAEQCDYCGSAIVRDTRDLSLICPECYARNAEDTRFCTSCGVAFRPQGAKVEGYELPCPACGKRMPPHHVGGIGVNECPGCKGLWVPRENFDVLINRAIAAHRQRLAAGYQPPKMRAAGGNPVTQKVEYRGCPECGKLMARRNFRSRSGVIVDRCPADGTWLDADELEQIAGYILSGGRPGGNKQARVHDDFADLGPKAPDLSASVPPEFGATVPPPGQVQSQHTRPGQPDAPHFSDRTREVLARRKAEEERKRTRGRRAARSVLGFLGELLTTEVSSWD